jgi:hypothetical protein
MKLQKTAILVVCAVAGLIAAAAMVGPRAAKALTFQSVTIAVATNLAATVSPADGHIVMDVHGALFSLPAAGGAATRLTDDFLEPARPDFSPDGKHVAFQAYKGGTFQLNQPRYHRKGPGERALGDEEWPRLHALGARGALCGAGRQRRGGGARARERAQQGRADVVA